MNFEKVCLITLIVLVLITCGYTIAHYYQSNSFGDGYAAGVYWTVKELLK